MKKEKVQYRIDNKLCTRCGAVVVENRKMCQKHLEESRLKEKRKRERRKNKDVCIRCGQRPPRPNRTQCGECAENNKDQYNAAHMDVYYQRRSASRCVRCNVPTKNFSVHCDVCATYINTKDKLYYYKNKDAGLCVHCRQSPPIVDEILCLACKKKNAICGKDSRVKQKMTVLSHYGGKCKMCNEDDMDVLGIDHIKGGGGQHRKKLTAQGTTMYRWIIKNNYPTNFQVLCFNCNMKKHLNGVP
ncbi:hypothetical protein KAR91_52885 [Candidatus Pacearchaeota archaeon]|nr:hypothetical protein [Candidatus Pacearchaeota archaeon]